jgi:hypothetical protein
VALAAIEVVDVGSLYARNSLRRSFNECLWFYLRGDLPMDPVSAVVGAIIAGATAIGKDIASQAVKDAYGALKELIFSKFKRKAPLEGIEEAPDSAAAREALGKSLAETRADKDPEVARLAQALVASLLELDHQRMKSAGIVISDVVSYRDAIIHDIAGDQVTITNVVAHQDVVIEGVRSGRHKKK